MVRAKVWKLAPRRWGGITARGKRITIVSSREKAAKLAGLSQSPKKVTKTKTKRRKINMPKRKRKGGGKSISRTAFKWLRVGALVAPAVYQVAKYPKTEDKIRQIMIRYTGYDTQTGGFEPKYLLEGYGPYLLTSLITYGIPKLTGILRRL